MVLHVGGADDRELVHPRDDKHDAFIFVLQNVGLLLGMHARHHNVAAFDEADAVRRRQVHAVIEELLHPRAGGVHQTARFPAELLAGIHVFRFHNPQTVFTTRGGGAGTGFYLAAFFLYHLRIRQHQTRIVHPAIGIFETAHDFRLKDRF